MMVQVSFFEIIIFIFASIQNLASREIAKWNLFHFFLYREAFWRWYSNCEKKHKIVRNKSNEMEIYFSDSIIDFYVNTFIYSLILLYVVFVNRWISWYMQIPAYVSFIVKAQMPKINLLHIDITYVWYKTEFSLNSLKCNILYNIMF